MSVIFRPKTVRIGTRSTASGRGMASLLTISAAILAVILAFAIPAHSNKPDSFAKTSLLDPDASSIDASTAHAPHVCALSIDQLQRSATSGDDGCIQMESFNHPRNGTCTSSYTSGQTDPNCQSDGQKDLG